MTKRTPAEADQYIAGSVDERRRCQELVSLIASRAEEFARSRSPLDVAEAILWAIETGVEADNVPSYDDRTAAVDLLG